MTRNGHPIPCSTGDVCMTRSARRERNSAAWEESRDTWSNDGTLSIRQSIKRARAMAPELYKGDNIALCNALTQHGHYCRGLALPNGRCKWHGGLSTGPRTAEGKAKVTNNLTRKIY